MPVTTYFLRHAHATGVVDGTGPVETMYGPPPRDRFLAAVTHCLTGTAVVDAVTVQLTDAAAGSWWSSRASPSPDA